jgi:hypothetical protein
MRISEVADAISADLAALGGLGDEATAETARRLAAAMQAPVTARLIELLGQVATELGAAVPGRRVELRLASGEVQFVVEATPEQPLPGEEAGGEGTGARITLRLPLQLKTKVEEASAREGLSLNAYIVRALSQHVRSAAASQVGRRLSGYGRS